MTPMRGSGPGRRPKRLLLLQGKINHSIRAESKTNLNEMPTYPDKRVNMINTMLAKLSMVAHC